MSFATSHAGTIQGQVSNAATRAFLQGASVEIPALGLRTDTDAAGAYVFSNLPAGEHVLVTSYTGLDMARASVTVSSGGRAVRDFDLISNVYLMESFSVVGDREGNAASITRQKNAPNVKNVVAMDAFGTLPNEALGEVLIRLPGVIGEFAESDSIMGVSIRGTPSELNTVNVDGNLQASVGGFGRDYRLDYVSGALFDELEVTKAPTPDMSADGLGGAVNIKTRSTLSMKERRRITYRAAARWAPSFYDHTPARRDHPVHPLFSLGYQQLFNVFGGARNLGVTFNAFYSENVSAYSRIVQDYEFGLQDPAYVWDYRAADVFVNRMQKSMNLKLDYKLSEQSRAFVNILSNSSPSPYNEQRQLRAFTGRTLATIGPDGNPAGTGAILPGYTQERTTVRPVPASTVQLNSTSYGFEATEWGFNAGAKHEYSRLKLDYDAAYSSSQSDLRNSHRADNRGGIFTMNVTNVGWLLDGSGSREEPTFTQNAGPSIFDGASYRSGLLTARDSERNTEVSSATANASYLVPGSVPLVVKSGMRYRVQEVEELVKNDRRWNYVGTAPLSTLAEPGLSTAAGTRLGAEPPFPNPSYVSEHIQSNPASWSEDHYYGEMRKFSGTRSLTESVSAAYLQAQMRFKRLTLLGGVRFERTDVKGKGHTPSRQLTAAAQRAADPIGSARVDYNNPRSVKGDYSDFFPGIHLTYNVTKNLLGRVSWSNSIGRPAMTSLLPLETANTTEETLTINNPSLKPQYAEKWDVSLEAYFEPVGTFSIGWFHKNIKDFIVSTRGPGGIVGTGTDNGYNGDYAGYTILTQFNGGSVVIGGWEFNYRQQLSFLPGILSGLGVFANYTTLEARGDYGDGIARGTREVANFVPDAANAGLTFRNRAFGARINANYTGDTLRTYSANAPQRVYQTPRTLVNAGLSYRWNREVEFACDVTNLFNSPQERYKYLETRPSSLLHNGTSITFSVSGTF